MNWIISTWFLGIKLSKDAGTLEVEYGHVTRGKWSDINSCSSNQTSDFYTVKLPVEMGKRFQVEITFCWGQMKFPNWFNVIIIWELNLRKPFEVVYRFILGPNESLFKRPHLRTYPFLREVFLPRFQPRKYSTLNQHPSARGCPTWQHLHHHRSR